MASSAVHDTSDVGTAEARGRERPLFTQQLLEAHRRGGREAQSDAVGEGGKQRGCWRAARRLSGGVFARGGGGALRSWQAPQVEGRAPDSPRLKCNQSNFCFKIKPGRIPGNFTVPIILGFSTCCWCLSKMSHTLFSPEAAWSVSIGEPLAQHVPRKGPITLQDLLLTATREVRARIGWCAALLHRPRP